MDTGIGIPREHMPKIFKLFHSSLINQQNNLIEKAGSGIGLSLCKKLVEKMGGEIELNSLEGQGTTVYFTIRTRTKQQSFRRIEIR